MKNCLFLFLCVFSFLCFGHGDTLSVYFDFDKFTLENDQLTSMRSLKERIKSGEVSLISSRAYCDTVGSNEYNMELCENRLNTILKILEVETNDFKIEPRVYGDNFPERFKSDYMDSLFRRVDIMYFDKSAIVPPPLGYQLSGFLRDTTSEKMVELAILFIGGKDELVFPNSPVLPQLAKFMKENPSVTAHIRGHVCCGDNRSLSNRRANKIKLYLLTQGIAESRLTAKGYSNSIPIFSPELTQDHKRRNRRVDILFTKRGNELN